MDRTSNLSRFCALFLLLMFQISLSLGVLNNITQGQSMRDGETLVSAGGVFELGFFSPSGTNNRYLGIWFKQSTEENVVWVADRELPLTKNTGALTIDDAGNLVIVDAGVGVVRSLYKSPSKVNSSRAILLDSGNFILRNETGDVVWESFDSPTDTYLAGMKLGLDRQAGKMWSLISWSSLHDPAPGSHSLGLDPNETRQLIIQYKDESIHWSSGSWNGEIFSLVPEMRFMFNYNYVSTGGMNYFIYSLYNRSTVPRLVLDASGKLKLLTWSNESKVWLEFWAQPRDECELYNSCGANARCNISAPIHCSCLEGFKDDLSRHQQSNLWRRRCLRRENFTCEDGDGFLQLQSVRFPDRSWYERNESMRTEDCELGCRSNCSCTAYASAYSNGTGGCLFWAEDLIGLRDSPPYADDNGFAMGNIYIRVAASDQGKKEQIHVIIMVIVPVIVIFISCILCYLLRQRKLKSKGEVEAKGLLPLEISTSLSAAKELVGTSNLNHGGRSRDLPFFSFSAVETATDNFSPANMLGQGGFGSVYKGKLADGQEMAVKRLSKSSEQGLEEFKNEVMVISELQHRNLVSLLGWCVHGEEKILIYEYMSNTSLEPFLFDKTKKSMLDWGKRIQIIEGIAQGLLYLHQYSRITVIHRDLKPSNVLLDNSMIPKISDFGTARIFGSDQSQANTKRVVGTYGYMSPEYAMDGIFSIKSDVFSFGVLLLEIVCGKKNSAAHYFDGSLNLLGYAWELWKDGRISELIDPLLVDSAPAEELARYVHVALLCVQNSSMYRPTMPEVVHMLTNKAATLGMPKQPAFSIERVAEADACSSKPKTCSVSDMTVSEINEGR